MVAQRPGGADPFPEPGGKAVEAKLNVPREEVEKAFKVPAASRLVRPRQSSPRSFD